VIAELKWIRKSIRPAETVDRDAEVVKGVEQLTKIRRFLAQTPNHLPAHGRLSRPLCEYDTGHYVLVMRDHWRWIELRAGFAIVEFDAFVRALATNRDLCGTANELLSYEWLPTKARTSSLGSSGQR
jgi:hypothetical protein